MINIHVTTSWACRQGGSVFGAGVAHGLRRDSTVLLVLSLVSAAGAACKRPQCDRRGLSKGILSLQNGTWLWCLKCGSYTSQALVGLRHRRKGASTNSSRVAKLGKGCPSLSGWFVGEPVRPMGEAWWHTTARTRVRNSRDVLVVELCTISVGDARFGSRPI